MTTPDIVPAGAAGMNGEITVPLEPVRAALDREPETDDEARSGGPSQEWVYWQKQIQSALMHEKNWRSEATHAERMYFGPIDNASSADPKGERLTTINDKVALIHSNIEVLKPLVFSETPQPIIRRRWNGDGQSDKTELMGAEAVQRLASYLLDTEDFDGAMIGARDDWLIAGRGSARVLYDVKIGQKVDPVTGLTTDYKADERVMPRHSEWARVLFAPSHSWHNMPWIAFEVPMSRSMCEKRFGPEKAARMSFNTKGLVDSTSSIDHDDRQQPTAIGATEESGAVVPSPFDTAMVWEIWIKENKQVKWWSGVYTDDLLDESPDFLNLEGFWPMAKPLLATTKGQMLIPRPDVRYYERRADEIEEASRKMNSIMKIISVSGLVPGTTQAIFAELFKGDNKIIPVAEWLTLMQKGGMSDLIQWLPLQPMITAIQALQAMREQSRQAMFEASGISDIMRAQGDPNETATAQQIKGKYAGLRLSDRQRRMAIFALDTLRIMIEIAVEHFDTAFLAEICGGMGLPVTEAERQAEIARRQKVMDTYQQMAQLHQSATQLAQDQASQNLPPEINPGAPPQEPQFGDPVPETSWELIHERLKSDLKRKIMISIETQSTILSDEASDKDARVEFLSAFSTFVSELMPLMHTGVIPLKTVKELLLFGIRGFPKSRTLETMISQIPDEMPPEPQPKEDVQVQVAKIRAEVDLQIEQMQEAHDIKMKGVDLVAKAADLHASPGPQHPEPPAPPNQPPQQP